MANQILYGFHTIQDLARERVVGNVVDIVSNAIQQAVEEHNRQMNALLDLFVMRTTEFKLKYRTATATRLQPLDEQGRARPIQATGNYDLAWPLQKGGLAWGLTRQARAKLTVAEAQRLTAAFLSADWRWIRDHILAALFTNVSWNFVDDIQGSLTIMPLANGDAITYQLITGADNNATANHFLAQAAAILDASNPFPTIYTNLSQRAENSGEVICFIPTNLKPSVEALSLYRAIQDPNLTPGANTETLNGSLGVEVPGKVIGYVSKCWIVEWAALPDNYIIGITSNGEKPLGMREEPEAELQGFAQVAQRLDHPFEETHWERIAGFGAWNRVGVVVYRIGNAAYAIPNGYGSPMP